VTTGATGAFGAAGFATGRVGSAGFAPGVRFRKAGRASSSFVISGSYLSGGIAGVGWFSPPTSRT
jgi:hypothetical protein